MKKNLELQEKQLYEKLRAIAIALKAAGTDPEQISELTGLSVEEITEL